MVLLSILFNKLPWPASNLGMPRGIPRTPSFPDTFSLDPSDDDDQYEDPSGEFDIESLKTASVAIPNHQVSKDV